ncbi:hypothetical protein [Streptomyces sp. NPDC001340]
MNGSHGSVASSAASATRRTTVLRSALRQASAVEQRMLPDWGTMTTFARA